MNEKHSKEWRYSDAPEDVLASRAHATSEVAVFAQPEISKELEIERAKIGETVLFGHCISPESLIGRAIQGNIDFLDLFAHHNESLNPRAEEFHRQHPDAKVVHVGLEFLGSGVNVPGYPNREGVVKYNKFLINYDALSFIKRLRDASVGFINIDFPHLELLANNFAELYRVLSNGGQVSFYWNPEEVNTLFTTLQAVGFTSMQTMPDEQNDLTSRRSHLSGTIVRVLAIK